MAVNLFYAIASFVVQQIEATLKTFFYGGNIHAESYIWSRLTPTPLGRNIYMHISLGLPADNKAASKYYLQPPFFKYTIIYNKCITVRRRFSIKLKYGNYIFELYEFFAL